MQIALVAHIYLDSDDGVVRFKPQRACEQRGTADVFKAHRKHPFRSDYDLHFCAQSPSATITSKERNLCTKECGSIVIGSGPARALPLLRLFYPRAPDVMSQCHPKWPGRGFERYRLAVTGLLFSKASRICLSPR